MLLSNRGFSSKLAETGVSRTVSTLVPPHAEPEEKADVCVHTSGPRHVLLSQLLPAASASLFIVSN